MFLFLVLLNFLLASFDCYLTQRRMRDYGSSVELNNIIRYLSTCLGPRIASLLGVLLPATLWTYLLYHFNLPILLALLAGFNLKRFEIQLASLFFERRAKNIKKMIEDYNKIAGRDDTLPSESLDSKLPACSSKDTMGGLND